MFKNRIICRVLNIFLILMVALLFNFLQANRSLADDAWPLFKDEWPMFQRDASHSGYIPITILPNTFSLKWERTLETFDLNPVSISNGKIFVTARSRFENSSLFALEETDGHTLWSKQFGKVNSVNPPSIAYGNVYIQTGKGINSSETPPYLRAYNIDTGDLVFRQEFAAQWERYYSPTIYNGTIYCNGGYYGGMYAFDAFTGLEKWYTSLPQYDQWTPAVDRTRAYAYLGEYEPALYVLDRFTGNVIYTIPDPNFDWNGWSMNLAPVLGSTNDIIVINSNRLLSFDLISRNIRWELVGNFTGQPSVINGLIYAINAGTLTVRDEISGEQLWAWENPVESIKGEIIVTNSHLFVHTSSTVYAINLETHEAEWSTEIPDKSRLSLVESTLYIAGEKGQLIAIKFEKKPGVKLNYLMPFVPVLLLNDKNEHINF